MTVTPPKPRDELSTAAARLSKAAPNSWKEFIEAMSKYTSDHRDACVQSPADRILVTQGKAQLAVELLTLFQNAAKQGA